MLFAPSSIFYPPYILSAFLFALAWLWFIHRKNIRTSLSLIFQKKIWLSRSNLIDLGFCIFFFAGFRIVIATVEDVSFQNSLREVHHFFDFLLPNTAHLKLSVLAEAILATAVTMLANDLASYSVHRWMHSWNFLWKIHRWHHSAKVLTPLTTYRQHPLEPILLYAGRGLASGIALACLHHFFVQQTPVITIFGLGAGFFIYMFTVNLHHFPVPIQLPKFLRNVLISPHIHHLHHSCEARHQGKNYGVVFSIWDRMFGTYWDEDVALSNLQFGLGDQ